MAKLTEKQKRFCDYYIETGNATEAAIKAGYSEKTAKVIGAENLTKPYLKSYIDERIGQLESNRIADAKEVMEYLTKIVRNEAKEEVVVVSEYGPEIIKKDVSIRDRNKAAELLGKRYRLFTDKVEVEGAIPIVITGDDEIED
ncbi:TPA: terminase small subunit [Clostridioides difficile]|uniref:terminase small subunit n=1 Tax=Clostridioides difficile TaxID=1496 RepID=UPI00038D2E30|nr:terminase small subunit [Clostridioides difficile]EGT3734896.1 terminase small subunit [Clostridioides difficile]EGT4112355.1 terminase small subunit [Clostridioides difficile]EGT4518509.1 terminase small subunit [Clostridioides difficile]EGT5022520.1 terminase small subunit [Clostridioides difficile]EGT5292529.1 terminase small subunit [Clostridioides difficile]